MTNPMVEMVPPGIRNELKRRVVDDGLPDAAYAAIGGVEYTRDQIAQLPDRVSELPGRAQGLPDATFTIATGALYALSRRSQSTVNQVREDLTRAYTGLVVLGEESLVSATAERAVRKRVARAEDRIAPRVAAAAVRVQARRRRRQQSSAANPGAKRSARARAFATRSAARFAEMNAPVLADPPAPHRS